MYITSQSCSRDRELLYQCAWSEDMDQEIHCYESIELNTYEKVEFQNEEKPNPYSAIVRPAAVEENNTRRLSCVTKLLIIGWVVNFVLIIAIGATLSYFLARTATKSQVGTISEAVAAAQGLVGPPGPAGKMGPPGETGPVGKTGPVGEKGDSGVGPPGEMGPPGPVGEKGDSGIGQPGPAGEKGDSGVVGQPGPPGSKGLKGSQGYRGYYGSRGPPGVKGTTGLVGRKGDRGRTGATGPPGVKGDRGLKGDRGQTGATGPPGTKGGRGASEGGVTYNRWGRSICRTGVELVYSGRTGATWNLHKGGAANYVCMPNDPQYTLPFRSGVQGYSRVYGTEYEAPLVSGRYQHNAPCAVCYIPTKHTVIMIPAKTSCPSGWTREYYGWLMSENRNYSRTMYTCVDRDMESIPGSQNHASGGHFFHVEADCNGVACPPYDNEKELNCVVCSK